jgi:hypothetical protein
MHSVEWVENRDWVAAVQADWKPRLLGNSLLVRFPWHTEEDLAPWAGVAGRKHLLLEGGDFFFLFGVGALCLEVFWLRCDMRQGTRYGTSRHQGPMLRD